MYSFIVTDPMDFKMLPYKPSWTEYESIITGEKVWFCSYLIDGVGEPPEPFKDWSYIEGSGYYATGQQDPGEPIADYMYDSLYNFFGLSDVMVVDVPLVEADMIEETELSLLIKEIMVV